MNEFLLTCYAAKKFCTNILSILLNTRYEIRNNVPGISSMSTPGDVAFRVVERIKSVSHRAMQGTLTDMEEDTHIYVCDINPNMLEVGKKRAAEKGCGS